MVLEPDDGSRGYPTIKAFSVYSWFLTADGKIAEKNRCTMVYYLVCQNSEFLLQGLLP